MGRRVQFGGGGSGRVGLGGALKSSKGLLEISVQCKSPCHVLLTLEKGLEKKNLVGNLIK